MFVSGNQHAAVKSPYPIAAIHNAVELEGIPFQATASKPPYLVFLGRITRNKGVHLAIEAAKRANQRLLLAGNVPHAESVNSEYFETEIEPELDEQIQWIGTVERQRQVQTAR